MQFAEGNGAGSPGDRYVSPIRCASTGYASARQQIRVLFRPAPLFTTILSISLRRRPSLLQWSVAWFPPSSSRSCGISMSKLLPTFVYSIQFCEELDQIEPDQYRQQDLCSIAESRCTRQIQN